VRTSGRGGKIPIVDRFGTIKQAKNYLAGRIIAEVSRDGAPLPEIERKLLYFSEADWTLPELWWRSCGF
jgi:hypothetical protein